MNLEEFKDGQSLAAMRKSKREEKAKTLWTKGDAPGRHWGTRDRTYPINQPKARKSKPRRKKNPSRKSLVRKADTAFSLHIRALYPTSFFSGKPSECCFHIVTRSKHSVRWALDNAVGSTMGENYEMEFNPHKFISILIQKRGLPWYENLILRSNEIRKHTRQDLELIAQMGFEAAGEIGS